MVVNLYTWDFLLKIYVFRSCGDFHNITDSVLDCLKTAHLTGLSSISHVVLLFFARVLIYDYKLW